MFNIKEKIVEEFENWKNINSKRIQIIKGKEENLQLSLGEIEIENIAIKETNIDKIEYETNTLTTMEAPIEQNTKIGTITIKLNGEILETVDIFNTNKIERKTWQDYFIENITLIPKLISFLLLDNGLSK
jgi:hypothetical protein